MVFNQPESDDSRLDTAVGNYDGNAEKIYRVEDDSGEGKHIAIVDEMED